ncbi:hypothetical protein EV174_004966 [Coemansia sp. RSA 2320]|nr:hypothetical protein EV174_004966 [Coemansia sp. RSA 2320]
MRQSFIKTLDRCLDTWMSSWIPDAFLYASLANPIHGTRCYVEKTLAASPMAQLGISTLSDPVSSLLLARFAVDFELTLTQSIYQLCEHAISIVPDDPSANGLRSSDGSGGAAKRAGVGGSALSSADASMSNLLSSRSDTGEPLADRVYSITASLAAARNDSMASATSRRGTFAGAIGSGGQRLGNGSMLNHRRAEHAAKWHGVAENLVKHFVMTVGQHISSDYLKAHPYDPATRNAFSLLFDAGQENSAAALNRRTSTYSSSSIDQLDVSGGAALLARSAHVVSVSEVWLNICRWMKQVEDDTNALFYDPVFSATTKELEAARTLFSEHAPVATTTNANATGEYNPLHHVNTMSNIDRLFAERVDVFPKRISSLTSGKILYHLAMQILKSAIESLRLRPVAFQSVVEFQQIVVDSAFVRSWMLRYAGISPNLRSPSSAPVLSQQQQQQQQQHHHHQQHQQHQQHHQQHQHQQPLSAAHVADPRRRSAMALIATPGSNAATAVPTISERDAQAIQNLLDDWINSASACAVEPVLPEASLVDRVVRKAWMSAYFASGL